MIVRKVSFADEDGRVRRIITVEAEDTRSLVVQTQRALDTRMTSEKFVFTSTSGGEVAPAVGDGPREHELETLRAVPGFQIIEPVTIEEAIRPQLRGYSVTIPAQRVQYSGGAPLNSVQARLHRDSE